MYDAAGNSLAKSHRRLVPPVPPSVILVAGAALLGSLLAVFGSLLLEMLRAAAGR